MAEKMYRQGDVLLVKIDKLPSGRRSPSKDKIILRGEATGHAHRLVGGDLFSVFGADRGMFIEIKTKGKVVHEEHGPLTLEKGFYEVVRQKEYSPYSDGGADFVLD